MTVWINDGSKFLPKFSIQDLEKRLKDEKDEWRRNVFQACICRKQNMNIKDISKKFNQDHKIVLGWLALAPITITSKPKEDNTPTKQQPKSTNGKNGRKSKPAAAGYTAEITGGKMAATTKNPKIDAKTDHLPDASKTSVATDKSANIQKNQQQQNVRHYAESKPRSEIKLLLQKQPSELQIIEYMSRQPERDNHMTELIKEYRGRRCQICSTGIRQKNGKLFVEAAHIDPKKDGGAETPANILVLCPNHHAEFDVGDRQIIERTDDRIVFVLNGVKHSLDLKV